MVRPNGTACAEDRVRTSGGTSEAKTDSIIEVTLVSGVNETCSPDLNQFK